MDTTPLFQKILSSKVQETPAAISVVGTVPGIKCYQWKGDNYRDIQEVMTSQLSGYVYRKDDDLIIDFNDGNSIKKVCPLDWILVIQEDNDVAVMSSNMFNMIRERFADSLDLSNSDGYTSHDTREDVPDQEVDINVETKYGDRLALESKKDKGMRMKFYSYQGDIVQIEHSFLDSEAVTKMSLNDRYGNKMSVNGTKLNLSSANISTSRDLYNRVGELIEKAKSKTNETFDILKKCIENSKKIAT